MCRILDDKYEKDEPNKVMNKKCQHLFTQELEILLVLLQNFEDLFYGTLGKWNKTLVGLELRDDVKPV